MESMQLPNPKRLDWQSVWVVVIALSFAFRIYIMIDPTKEPVYQLMYSLLYVAVATRVLQCERFRARRDFRLMALCVCWAIFSCALPRYEEREMMQLAYYFLMIIFAFFVCYPLAFVLPEERAHRALDGIAATYLALIAMLCGVGIYAAVSGTVVPSLAGPGYVPAAMVDGRLTIFSYPTIASTFCCLGLLVGLYLLMRKKRVWMRVACALAMLVAFVALSLTDSRTSGIFFSLCFGGFCFLIADTRLPVGKRALRVAAALVIAAVALAASYGGLKVAYKAVNAAASVVQRVAEAEPEPAPQIVPAVQTVRLSAAPTPVPPDAQAEAEPADEPAARPLLENLSTLQGRTYAWEAALRALKNEPMLLLTGSSPLFVMERVEPYVEQFYGMPFPHLHSIFLQTLVAYGLPGLLLFGALALYILYHAVRLFFCGAQTCSLAERTLPLIIFFCLAVDVLEIFLSFFDVVKHSNPWFFLAGGYVVYLSQTRIGKKPRKKAAA